jgi:hypothetical protein
LCTANLKIRLQAGEQSTEYTENTEIDAPRGRAIFTPFQNPTDLKNPILTFARSSRCLLLSLTLLTVSTVRAQDATPPQEIRDIPPPFGLRWGEDMDRMEKLLVNAKAKVVSRTNVDGRLAWTVEGIIQANLKRTIFYFNKGLLVEVELQYQGDNWTADQYDNFMSDVRRKLESRFGTGQLISRSKKPEGDVMETLVGYKWNQNNTSIQLFYFSAEGQQPEQSYRTVSVHYKIQK